MNTPLIGISGATADVDSPIGRITWAGVNRAYAHAIELAGGIPVVLPIVDSALADYAVQRIDGLIMTGGGDINPRRYSDDQPAPEIYGVSDDRDAFDDALVKAAYAAQLPLLAICRGMQMLNVAFGGTLRQHLHDGPAHLDPPNAYSATQTLAIEPGTNLHAIIGANQLLVNSLHHQAVQTLGASLRATALSADGIVEGLEIEGCPNAVGVQWHPELLPHDAEHRRLFDWLVSQACARR